MITAGPYELVKQEKNFYEKVTFCLMDDNSISQRHYNKYGNVMTQQAIPNPDIESAIQKLDLLMNHLKHNKYIVQDLPLSKVPKTLGKKSPDAAPKKREKKENTKQEAAIERRSARQAAGPKPVYDEEKIFALRDEPTKMAGDESINVMLAQTYNPDEHDPTGWLMSEKLDGVRCYWSGNTMYTRNGNKIFAPDAWIAKLPKVALDGELWSGRDAFQQIVSTVRKTEPEPEKWNDIKFMIFDGPSLKGNFSSRIKQLEQEIGKDNRVVKLINQTVCKNKEHLEQWMDQICGGKGEGVMIKDPKSKYEGRRSFSLLKVKRFEDAEATVIGHQQGTGRCEGMCGAIIVREKDGTEFKIGSGFDDKQRRSPPKKGSVVTFKFQGRTNAGIPRFPIFMRIHPGM